jgi:predicted RecA/RadA family phage recombinase
MATATFWQKGERIDYPNATTAAIPFNTVIVFGSRIGVAGNTIPAGETGSLVLEGVFKMPKKSAEAFTAGEKLYWDVTNSYLTGTAGDVYAGIATAAAASADTEAYVRL